MPVAGQTVAVQAMMPIQFAAPCQGLRIEPEFASGLLILNFHFWLDWRAEKSAKNLP